MSRITYISGLFRNIRNGIQKHSDAIVDEIRLCLLHNPQYADMLVCYADCLGNAQILTSMGLHVHKIIADAPDDVVRDSRYKMKHWMIYDAVKEFGDVVWIDWDTYNIRPIDNDFEQYCLSTSLPKFTWIKGDYWAVVNCAVYYCNKSHLPLFEESFHAQVSEPNDELMWAAVLPKDIRSRSEFWLNGKVVNIWVKEDFDDVVEDTYFLHLKDFDLVDEYHTRII